MENDKTLKDYIDALAGERSEKRLFGDADGWITAEHLRLSAYAAADVFWRAGISAGDFIALMTQRSVPCVIALMGLHLLGAVVVLCDPREPHEVYAGERMIPIKAEVVCEKTLRYRIRCGGTEHILSAESDRETKEITPVGTSISASAPAFIIFTSGSTGHSKAVVLSAGSLINNLLDAAPLGWYLPEDIALGILPLQHVFGLVLLLGTFVLGYAVYFPRSTRAGMVLEDIERERITRMNGVPSLYLALAREKGARELPSLRCGFIGGAPCTQEQFYRIEDTLGMTLIPAYGMSECVGITCASYRDRREDRAGSVGRFYPRNVGRIVEENGEEAALYEEGEICVDGPARMIGYFGETHREPLLRTGDLGYLDERGFVHISGRKKDIIIRNGINLSVRRIEEALLSVTEVSEAVVAGLPDPGTGEVPYAMVASGLLESELLEKIRPVLRKNELPAGIFVTEEIPHTAAGKPDRGKIREVLLQWRNG